MPHDAGWIGNVIYNPDNIKYFAIYFSVTLSIVLVMFTRTRILKVVLYFLANTFLDRYIGKWIRSQGTPSPQPALAPYFLFIRLISYLFIYY
jgi:hypothetical protein